MEKKMSFDVNTKINGFHRMIEKAPTFEPNTRYGIKKLDDCVSYFPARQILRRFARTGFIAFAKTHRQFPELK